MEPCLISEHSGLRRASSSSAYYLWPPLGSPVVDIARSTAYVHGCTRAAAMVHGSRARLWRGQPWLQLQLSFVSKFRCALVLTYI